MSSSTAVAKVTAPASPATPVLLTVSVMLATIMQALDTTIANVALPTIAAVNGGGAPIAAAEPR